jgi:hypothetical protein
LQKQHVIPVSVVAVMDVALSGRFAHRIVFFFYLCSCFVSSLFFFLAPGVGFVFTKCPNNGPFQ